MTNRRKLRRLKEPKKAFELGVGLTTYENVTDDELCRWFRTHEHPLVEELVSRLELAEAYEGEVDELDKKVEELDKKIEDLEGVIDRVIDWGTELAEVILVFINQEKEAEEEDDRPTIEDLVEAYESIDRPKEVER